MKADVTNHDVLKAIAQQSDLTQAQVQQCFKTYRSIIEQIVDSPSRPNDYSIPIPYIGKIKFSRVHNNPNREIKGAIKHVDLSKAKIKEEYDKMTISIYNSLRKRVKEISYQRFLKLKEVKSLAKQD
jgi:hypothetical protein